VSELQFDEGTHTYTVDGAVLPSVTQILDALGLMDKTYYTEETRDRGTAIHEAIFWIEQGILTYEAFGEGHPLAGYIAAWRSFRETSGFEIRDMEARRYHSTMRYAGTIDVIAHHKGKAVVDMKSGLTESWHGVQLAAYAELEQDVKHRYVLELHNTGKFSLVEHYKGHAFTEPMWRKAWVAAATLHAWRRLWA